MANDVGTQIFIHFFKLFYQKNIVTKYENNVVSISENHQMYHLKSFTLATFYEKGEFEFKIHNIDNTRLVMVPATSKYQVQNETDILK